MAKKQHNKKKKVNKHKVSVLKRKTAENSSIFVKGNARRNNAKNSLRSDYGKKKNNYSTGAVKPHKKDAKKGNNGEENNNQTVKRRSNTAADKHLLQRLEKQKRLSHEKKEVKKRKRVEKREEEEQKPLILKKAKIDEESIYKKFNLALTSADFPQVAVMDALEELGFEKMAQIQELVIPPLLEGKDAIVHCNGKSGKTLAFLLPALELCIKNTGTKALLLLPTIKSCWELQKDCTSLLSDHREIIVQTLSAMPNEKVSTKVHVIISTPGIFNTYIMQEAYEHEDLQSIKFCMIDEMDVLEDMGVFSVLKNISKYLPPSEERQMVVFSAKQHADIADVIDFKEDVVHLVSAENRSNNFSSITHEYITTTTENLFLQLKSLLLSLKEKKVIVFLPEVSMLQYLKRVFYWNVGDVSLITGRVQADSLQEAFLFTGATKGIAFVLPEAAKIMKIPDVDVVIWMGSPLSVEDYTEQVDRPSRMVAGGRSIVLLRPFESFFVEEAEEKKRITFTETILDAAEEWSTRLDDEKQGDKVARNYLTYIANNIMAPAGLTKQEVGADFVAFAKILGVKKTMVLEKDLRRLGLDGAPRHFRFKIEKEKTESELEFEALDEESDE